MSLEVGLALADEDGCPGGGQVLPLELSEHVRSELKRLAARRAVNDAVGVHREHVVNAKSSERSERMTRTLSLPRPTDPPA